MANRTKPAYRDPKLIVKDIINIQNILNGPIIIIGDLLQKGQEYADEIFQLLKEFYFDVNYTIKGQSIYIHSTDISKTIKYFKDLDVEAESLFEVEEAEYKVQRLIDNLGITIFTLVVFGASSLSFYFIIRSSLISRIYEVSVYRALGVSKNDIRKMFVTEIILITSITSLVGYLFMTYFLLRLQNIVDDFVEVFHISFISLLGGILLIYIVNIVSGLIPVSNLLRKTPAEILSKYDF